MHRCSARARRLALGLAGLLFLAAPVSAAEWGTLKGQVVCDGPVPAPKKIDVNKDAVHCLSKGPLFSEKYVINPKNKGVRWVAVWLQDAENPKKVPPINPKLKAVSPKNVEISQPCCQFEPHVLAMREGQTLVIKNPAPIAHNIKIDGGPLGPNINPIMPAKAAPIELTGIKARPSPIPFSCGIHGWMNGYIRVFKHPYFAVTDEDGRFEIKGAPAGKWHLVVWHETGWVKGDKNGTPITVQADKTTDLGEIPLKPE